MLRLRRKGDVLLMQLAAGLRDVERVVGDTLKVRDRMQELRDILVLPVEQLTPRDLHEVGAEPVLIAVDDALELLDRKSVV